MPPRREDRESDELVFPASQSSNQGEETGLERAIAMQFAAEREKKRQEKEKKFISQASTMLKKQVIQASDEMQETMEGLETTYTNFVNEYAETEDRIHILWLKVMKEHQTLEALIRQKYDAGVIKTKEAEKLHISGLSKLRAGCEETEAIISKMVPESDEDEEET